MSSVTGLYRKIKRDKKSLIPESMRLKYEIIEFETGVKIIESEIVEDVYIVEEINGFSIYDAKEKILCIDMQENIYVFNKLDLGIVGDNINYDILEYSMELMFLDADEIKEAMIPLDSFNKFKDPLSNSESYNELYTYINGLNIVYDGEYHIIEDNETKTLYNNTKIHQYLK